MRSLAFFVALVTISLAAQQAEACWWRHHCNCHHRYAASSSRAPVSAPSQAAVLSAPSYAVYQPVAMSPAAPSNALNLGGILSLIGGGQPQVLGGGLDIVKILEVVRDLRDRDRPGTNGEPSVPTSSVADIEKKLDRLLEGQDNIKGRLINNAGILQKLGKATVDQGKVITKIEERVSAGGEGSLMGEIARLSGEIKKLRDGMNEGGG